MAPKLSALSVLGHVCAFNNKDYANQHAYYDDDVELVLPDKTVDVLCGKAAIAQHYMEIHDGADEAVIPIFSLSDRQKIFLKMDAFFKFKKEVNPAVFGLHVHAGDLLKLSACAIYHINKTERSLALKVICSTMSCSATFI